MLLSKCECVAGRCLLLYSGLTQGQGHTVRQEVGMMLVKMSNDGNLVGHSKDSKEGLVDRPFYFISPLNLLLGFVCHLELRFSWDFLTMKQGDISSRRPYIKWRTKYLLWEVPNSPIWKIKTYHRDLRYCKVLKTETSSPCSFPYSSPIDMNGLPSELNLDPRGNTIG